MHMLRLLAGFAITLVLCAAAIGRGDRETVTPPPDASAEGFFREVVTERFDRVRPYVVQEPSDEQLRALLNRIEAKSGKVDDVQAELISRTQDRALVTVRLESATTTDAIPVSLSFTEGEWKLDAVP